MSSPKTISKAIGTFFLGLCLTACTRSTPKDSVSGEVNLAIWGNYLSNEARARFTKQTGLRLNVSNYSSNEELLAKVQTGASGLDVVVPSDYMIDVMIKLNLLSPLDQEKIPNAKGVLPEFLAQSYDPKNEFSLPYAMSLTGIALNRDVFKGEIKSWKDLFESPALAGKIALLDDVREVTSAVLKMNGQSVNTTDPEQLAKAQAELLKIRKNIKMFTSDSVDILKNKEVAAAQAFSMDSLQAAAATGGQIEFVIPSEGSTQAMDNLAILATAKNKENALRLINFLLDPENNLEFVKAIKAGPVIRGVREKLPPELRDSPVLFPSAKVLKTLERVQDLGEKNRLMEDVWTKVKTAR